MAVSQAPAFLKKTTSEVVRRLIMSIVGREKSGKTNLGLTAPDPIAILDFDYGLEGVVQKFSGKKVYTSEYRINEISADKFKSEADRFKKEYRALLADKFIRSIIVDTGTEMWELFRMAAFGKLTQVMPHQYGPVNGEVRSLIRDAYSSNKNVIFLHKMGEKYLNNQPTGQYIMAGFKDMPYAVQVNCLMWRETDGDRSFHCEITDCRQEPFIVGVDLIDSMITFQTLATMVFPGTNEEEWK